jgi:hypothetical protein
MTTPQPPRRHIEPLPPPPGAFDAVVNRARTRRYHRLSAVAGVATIFVAGIAGGLALGGQVSNVPNNLYRVATGGDDDKAATSAPPTGETTSAAANPSKSSKPEKSQNSPASTLAGGTERRLQVRGRVVDGNGDPVGGLFVYTGTVSASAFVPTSGTPAAITGVHGGYAVPCTDGPVLLTSWELNVPQGLYADGQWAATLVTKSRCGYDRPRKVTEISPGASIFGHVHTDAACADSEFPMWLWLGGHRTTGVRLSHLTDGDGFLISGLPQGSHILSARGGQVPVTVGATGQVTEDVEVACPDEPPPTENPTDSPSPTVTPEPTDTPPGSESSPSPTSTP